MSTVRKMYKELPADKLEFIVSYKYQGKTADEWMQESSNATGFDEDGHPKWYKFQALAEDTITLAKIMYDERNMDREIKFDPNLTCDICGKKGAYDFMGDFYCEDCFNKSNDGVEEEHGGEG